MKTLTIILFLLLPFNFIAQNPKPLRMEIEVKNNSDNYNIISLNRKGMLLYYQSINRQTNNNIWSFAKYDTIFNKIWNDEILIPKNLELVKYDFDKSLDNFYFLFLKNKRSNSSNFNSNNKGDFIIISLNTTNGEHKITKGMFTDKIILNDFKVIGNTAFIGSNSRPAAGLMYLSGIASITLIPMFTGLSFYKFSPEIISVDLSNNEVKTIKPVFKNNSYLLNEQTSLSSGKAEITAIIKNVINRKKSILYFNKYDNNGTIIKSENLLIPSDSTIVSVKLTGINNDNLLIGTFNCIHRHRLKYNPLYNAMNELTLPSEGVFFSKFTNSKADYIKFYSFNNFENFKTISNDQEKFKLLGRKKIFSNDFRYILHDLTIHNNEYLMLAEAFYPEYHLEYFWSTDIHGRSFQESREVFDGFRYSHAIIVAFDMNGNKIWDNSFEIWDILTYNLRERIKLMFDNDNIVLSYSNEGKINSKIIHKNQVIQAKEATQIEAFQSKDSQRTYLTSDMENWYKNYFINFGYESTDLKNKSKNSKTIFYINKIAFQ